MKRPTLDEQSVAATVVAWLEARDADVYQEVAVPGGVADIVARVGVEIWIVEVKTSLSIALLTQAIERRRSAHRVYIAAPYTRNQRDVAGLCSELGIGLLSVRVSCPSLGPYDGAPRVDVLSDSSRWNSRPVALAKRLAPEHKTHAKAGAVGAAGRWTPYRNTCEQLARIVAREPGITLKSALTQINHHYRTTASAVGSLAKWIETGRVDGVKLERDGKKALLYPKTRSA